MYEYGLVEALKHALKSDNDMSEHLNGIYSYVPAEVLPPYIKVQACQDLSLSPTLIYGDVVLTIVSRYRGQLEVAKLLKILRQALQKPLITTRGHHLIFKEEALSSTLAPDNITQSVSLTFRVKLKLNQKEHQ